MAHLRQNFFNLLSDAHFHLFDKCAFHSKLLPKAVHQVPLDITGLPPVEEVETEEGSEGEEVEVVATSTKPKKAAKKVSAFTARCTDCLLPLEIVIQVAIIFSPIWRKCVNESNTSKSNQIKTYCFILFIPGRPAIRRQFIPRVRHWIWKEGQERRIHDICGPHERLTVLHNLAVLIVAKHFCWIVYFVCA